MALFLISAFVFVAPSSAEQGISAHNVKVTDDYVMGTGVCSCSLCEDRYHHKQVFENYCPYCHRYGVLNYEEASQWPEGIWYCTECDADFCLIHGKEHKDPTNAYLIPYNGVIDGFIVKDGYITNQKIQDSTEVQAQSMVSKEYVELKIDNQTYKIDKQKLEDLKKAIY
ncbi:MAG: hypothetical protein ACXVHS_07685 [Methanobacterium sp.]